jgi:hypothetical protein
MNYYKFLIVAIVLVGSSSQLNLDLPISFKRYFVMLKSVGHPIETVDQLKELFGEYDLNADDRLCEEEFKLINLTEVIKKYEQLYPEQFLKLEEFDNLKIEREKQRQNRPKHSYMQFPISYEKLLQIARKQGSQLKDVNQVKTLLGEYDLNEDDQLDIDEWNNINHKEVDEKFRKLYPDQYQHEYIEPEERKQEKVELKSPEIKFPISFEELFEIVIRTDPHIKNIYQLKFIYGLSDLNEDDHLDEDEWNKIDVEEVHTIYRMLFPEVDY